MNDVAPHFDVRAPSAPDDAPASHAIATTRSHFEAIIESSDDAIISKTVEGIVTSWNPAATRMFGYAAEEMIGQSLLQIFPLDRVAEEQSILQKILVGTKVHHFETVRRRKDGSTIHVSATVSPIRDASGSIVGASSITRDITERHESEYRLRMAASVFTHASEAILITDGAGVVMEVNDAFESITGHARIDVVGCSALQLLGSDAANSEYAAIVDLLRTQDHGRGEIQGRRKGGGHYVALVTVNRVSSPSHGTQHVVLMTDITALHSQQKLLERLAHVDPLTGLPNRRVLLDRLQQVVRQAGRRMGWSAVVYLDLDGFKAVNDLHGHAGGDALLLTLARRMQAVVREGDTLARLGGDEFVLLFTDLDSQDVPSGILDRLLQACGAPVELNGGYAQVSASVGVVFCNPADSVDAEALLKRADQAMYEAKQAGRNRMNVCVT